MSRIGKKPVAIPEGVTATVDGRTVTAKGPKGELQIVLDAEVTVEKTEDGIKISPRGNTKVARSKWGLSRTLVANIMVGVTEGYTKSLEINGVGYRAAMQGNNVKLLLGFSHDVVYEVPEGVTVVCPKPTEITVSGIDKQKVGQVAAEIRSYRSPEPYKGKGVKYADEVIFRKEGKKK
ncbi:MAG: 50S ribosomal protein L6 [Hyphomicrobiales bacterium]|nr:50S ribosomal protein L6 [Hyphomicrobiales bacterium]PCH49899.1 MAG: 50S ribosomal protein L6 [Hyphomicrobiales bacterium]PCH50929.1 MAG: 50S ribosomal protein L6 [Hyphomicrobiales bacterium]